MTVTASHLTKEDIRDRINAIDRLLLQMLAERSFLVRTVGKIKHANGESLQASDREAEMFARMKKECAVLGLNFDYISELWSTMIYYSKVMECEEVGIDSFLNKSPIPMIELQSHLLKLTSITAPNYDDYVRGDGSDAIRAYRDREQHLLEKVVIDLPSKGLALDIGCATGQIMERLELSFQHVRGIDISPEMCRQGQTRREWPGHVTFQCHDVFQGIPEETGSASLLVANFGCASELGDKFLAEVSRVLCKGGRALLSYYNRDALLNYWFYPWPSTVKARLNRHNNTLEVWTSDTVFSIHATGKTVHELKTELRGHGLHIVNDAIETYPTLQAIVPRFFYAATRADSKETIKIAKDIDSHLARSRSGIHRGTYILVDVQKQ